MHIPDGWIDLPTSAAASVTAAGGVAAAARAAGARLRARTTTLPAVAAAYVLVAQLLVVPVGLGTSAHVVGTGLATLLVGPATAIVCVAAVVVAQALLFAEGGVTAIGLNTVNDGIVPALVAAAVYTVLVRRRSQPVAAGVAAALASLSGGLMAAAEFAVGGNDVVDARTVAAAIGGSHLLVAAVEGLLTAGVVRAVARLRPDLLWAGASRPSPAEAR